MSALSDVIVGGIKASMDPEAKASVKYIESLSSTMAETARAAQLDSMDRIRKMLVKAKQEDAPDSYINALEKLMPVNPV